MRGARGERPLGPPAPRAGGELGAAQVGFTGESEIHFTEGRAARRPAGVSKRCHLNTEDERVNGGRPTTG